MSLFRDTAFSALSTIAGTGVRFLVTIMLARTLAPEAYGQFVFLQWVIDLSALLFSFGLPGTMTRFLPQLISGGGGAATIRRLLAASAASILFSLCVFLVYARLDHRVSDLPFWWLGLWCVLSVTQTFLYAGLQGLFRYDAVMAGNLAFAAVAPIAALLVVERGSPVTGAIAMALAFGAAISAAVAAWRFLPARTRPPSPAHKPIGAKALWTYGASLWASSLLAGLVWSRGELGVLRLQADNSHIAIYAAALTLTGLIAQGTGLLTGAITPHLVRRWSSEDPKEVEELLLGITQLTFFAASGLSLVLIGFGRIIVPLLFGQPYADMYPVLCLLAASGISVACGCAHLVLQIETNARFGLFTDVMGLVLLLAIGAALVPFFGISGVAVGRAISQIAVAAATFWQLRRLPALVDASNRILLMWLTLLAINGVTALAFWLLDPGLVASLVTIPLIILAATFAGQRIIGANMIALLRMR